MSRYIPHYFNGIAECYGDDFNLLDKFDILLYCNISGKTCIYPPSIHKCIKKYNIDNLPKHIHIKTEILNKENINRYNKGYTTEVLSLINTSANLIEYKRANSPKIIPIKIYLNSQDITIYSSEINGRTPENGINTADITITGVNCSNILNKLGELKDDIISANNIILYNDGIFIPTIHNNRNYIPMYNANNSNNNAKNGDSNDEANESMEIDELDTSPKRVQLDTNYNPLMYDSKLSKIDDTFAIIEKYDIKINTTSAIVSSVVYMIQLSIIVHKANNNIEYKYTLLDGGFEKYKNNKYIIFSDFMQMSLEQFSRTYNIYNEDYLFMGYNNQRQLLNRYDIETKRKYFDKLLYIVLFAIVLFSIGIGIAINIL